MPSLSLPYDPKIGPRIKVSFAQAGALAGGQGRVVPATFLVDTGASLTSISPQIAQRVGLRSLGKIPVSAPVGLSSLNTYLVDLLVMFGDLEGQFPNGDIPTFPAPNLLVMDYLGRQDYYQGLLGRDILDRGILKVVGPERRYTLILPDSDDSSKISVSRTPPPN